MSIENWESFVCVQVCLDVRISFLYFDPCVFVFT